MFRPVLKFAKYDTLNYKTPLKYLFRVSYLGNLRTGLIKTPILFSSITVVKTHREREALFSI